MTKEGAKWPLKNPLYREHFRDSLACTSAATVHMDCGCFLLPEDNPEKRKQFGERRQTKAGMWVKGNVDTRTDKRAEWRKQKCRHTKSIGTISVGQSYLATVVHRWNAQERHILIWFALTCSLEQCQHMKWEAVTAWSAQPRNYPPYHHVGYLGQWRTCDLEILRSIAMILMCQGAVRVDQGQSGKKKEVEEGLKQLQFIRTAVFFICIRQLSAEALSKNNF